MANEILAALPLSRNDVSSFANLIHETLQAYCANYSPLEREYLLALRTIVGLSFTAALVCDKTSCCEAHLATFLKHRDYKNRKEASAKIALAVTELLNDAIYLFQIIRYPHYYKDFVAALKHIGHQTTLTLREKSEEVNRLMKLILNKKE